MPQNPLLADKLQIEPGTTTYGTRSIDRDTTDGSLRFADPNVTALLSQLVGIRNITGLFLVGRAGDGAAYTTIQDALDAIPDTSSPTLPSVVLVSAGEYDEALTIDKDGVYLVGMGGVTITQSSGSTLSIGDAAVTTPEKVVLRNLRIENTGAAGECVSIDGSGTYASGTVTVNTAPLVATDTILIGGVPLVGVSGSRTSGSDNYSVDGANVAAIAAEIVEAINDVANSFAATVEASFLTGVVTLTATVPGVGGNAITLTTSTTPAGGLVASGANLTGGSAAGSPVAQVGIDIIDCELVASGVGGFQIDADTVNNILVQGGSWRGSSSTSLCRITQCASFRVFGVEWLNDLELSYDNGNDQPAILTSEYSIQHCSQVGDVLTNLVGVGSLSVAQCPVVGNLTGGGDRTVDVRFSTLADVALDDTVAMTLYRSRRESATVAGGTPTFDEASVGGVGFVATASVDVFFDIPQPDGFYGVFLDSPTIAVTLAVTAKSSSSFTISASAPFTGTVWFHVTRSL